jgi:hypothetical protein
MIVPPRNRGHKGLVYRMLGAGALPASSWYTTVFTRIPILLANSKAPKFEYPTCLLGRQKSLGNLRKKKVLLEL